MIFLFSDEPTSPPQQTPAHNPYSLPPSQPSPTQNRSSGHAPTLMQLPTQPPATQWAQTVPETNQGRIAHFSSPGATTAAFALPPPGTRSNRGRSSVTRGGNAASSSSSSRSQRGVDTQEVFQGGTTSAGGSNLFGSSVVFEAYIIPYPVRYSLDSQLAWDADWTGSNL